MSRTIDLDDLIPEPSFIRLGGNDIEVKPPKLKDIILLGRLGQKMQGIGELSSEEADQLTNDLVGAVKSCIPELEGHDLNVPQLLKLVEIISQVGTPQEAKALEEKGITANSPKV